MGQWLKAKGCRARHCTHFHAGCRSPRIEIWALCSSIFHLLLLGFGALSCASHSPALSPLRALQAALEQRGPSVPWTPLPPAPFLITSLLPRRLGHLQAGALAPIPRPVVQVSRDDPRRNTRAPLVTSECPALFLGSVQCPLSLWETHPLWEARPSSCPVDGQCCQALCSTRASL